MDTLFCVLGDCSREECHHCFPVKKCSSKHQYCVENGCCDEIDIAKKILVTGCAGFIGFHTCKYLLENHYIVYGIDNLNNYYDVKIKEKHIEQLKDGCSEKVKEDRGEPTIKKFYGEE